ncbi:SCO6745 family protein [Streptosporangium sp. DT93]|uniref:SCO6745 family protein n=1 Tax=Streptosporangium sp. DT93 TaxID=3393428 RepID=UPI003CF2F511
MWGLLEPLHVVTYFTAEARAAVDAVGMRGFWMGYFATRAAPLGPVGPGVVTAAFHGFPPAHVARALPDAWTFATPGDVLRARLEGAGNALRSLLGAEALASDGMRAAAELAWEAAALADTAGRVLGAANQALPAPDEPHLVLWQAATTLREHRGDGHVAALVAHDVSPVEAHLLKVAAGETDMAGLRIARRFEDEAWEAGAVTLRTRGWVDASGALTPEGARERELIERLTDEAAARPWRDFGQERTADLSRLLRPFARAVVESGVLPPSSPVGLPWPSFEDTEDTEDTADAADASGGDGRERGLPAVPSQVG